MELVTTTAQEHRLARAWYVKYPLDAYALGPYRFDKPTSAADVSEIAHKQFGERPREIWPDGQCEEVEPYDYELDVPEDD